MRYILESRKRKKENLLNGGTMNLLFTPSSRLDRKAFQKAIDESIWYCEYHSEVNSFYFEEEEDLIDNLEKEIQQICNVNNIDGYFEAEEDE